MHIVLISACEKRSLKKTRAVLDSYAVRAGDSTWMTPITRAGLVELRMLLRRNASKSTSVACYQNDGRKQMKLLWIVGNTRKFGANGAFPVASQSRKRTPLPLFSKAAALLASSAGFMHDIGKFGELFQEKLHKNVPIADPVRHEWLSLFVVRQLVAGKTWQDAWRDMQGYDDLSPFEGQLKTGLDVLLFMIATHHRLPVSQSEKSGGFNPKMSSKGHVRDKNHIPTPVCAPEQLTMDVILDRLGKVAALPEQEPLYWRALALFSRMALILADHSVSAEQLGHKDARAYANTDRKTGEMNQRLDWHLQNVGHTAGDMVFNMLSLAPPSLSRDAVERICRRATGRYAWQERAARALSASADKHACPHLVFNMASTGSGKTRMNIRAICELSHGKPVRVATALNLRTLTLQTGDAYAEQIGIDRDELACVIGDRLTQALYEFDKQGYADDDENPLLEDYTAFSDFEYLEAPTWLKKFIDKKPHSGKVIGAPVLVSTIDFLIAAGEPHRQGNHALAALRLMTGDLILDEIDGYDPQPLLAVLRLVLMSAFFGRNVVVSSGTLSQPVACAVWRAYQRGMALRAALYGTSPDFVAAAIDDQTAPSILKAADMKGFEDFYKGKIGQIMESLKSGGRYRIPCLQAVSQKDEAGFMAAIEIAVRQLHTNHHLCDPVTGKRISFGLVRMANINPAVQVAKHLSKQLPDSKIACYHANHFPLLRFHIERRLDALLSRKNKDGDAHLFADEEIREAIDRTGAAIRNILFIVVATPVEEIGRDHDFDWAVIEPSSTQSIVQTAGRVNRHRLIEIDKPNVAILQFNWKAIVNGRNYSKPVFEKPGLECSDDLLYPSHDLEKLLDWETLRIKLDAAARFGEHEFALLDNRNMNKATEKWLDRILGNGKNGHLWMCQDVYERTPLRDHQAKIEITLEDIGDPKNMKVKDSKSDDAATSRRFDVEGAICNGWLYLEDAELLELADDAGVSPENGLTVSVRGDMASASKYKRHRSFGFYRG